MNSEANAVVLRGLKKYFPGTKALDWKDDDVIEIRKGEIHGLVGENGAGKSTTFQILMGIYDKTGGEIELFGEPYNPQNVHDAEAAGISIVMQQPNFADNLTVAENVFLGCDKKFRNKLGLIDWKRQNREAKEILDRLGYTDIEPTTVLGTLGYEKTKQVEIARALSTNPRVLLVDETSAAISKESAEKLYALLKGLKNQGCAILYISHFIEEVYELCDRVSILRDGKLIAKMPIDESVTPDMIVKNMVGRDMSTAVYRSDDNSSIGDVLFETKGLGKRGEFEDIDIRVRSGEIVGIAGIGGCGSEAFGKALFGYESVDAGKMYLEGREIRIRSPLDAMRLGIGLIPKDREKEGLFLQYGSVINIASGNMRRMSRRGIVNHAGERNMAEESVKQFLIKTPSVDDPVSDMSGGNRQKVVIAKWIVNESKFLIVNSPTRGVDIGAKYEIYKILEDLKNEGSGILLISDELPELIGMCDKVYSFKQGKVSGEFERMVFTEEKIATQMV